MDSVWDGYCFVAVHPLCSQNNVVFGIVVTMKTLFWQSEEL